MTPMQVPNPKQKYDDMTWLEKVNFIRELSLYPALTVMVFIRRRVGFRLLKPTWLIVLTIIMLLTPVFFSSVAQPFGFLMVIYAFSMLGLGMYQRWLRWGELCRGVRWHTYSPGLSYLEYLPVPRFFRTHNRINRYLDPVAVLLVGGIVTVVLSRGLGLWISFSAFFLYVCEHKLHELQLAQDLDTLDGMVAAEVQMGTIKFFDSKQPQERQRTFADSNDIGHLF